MPSKSHLILVEEGRQTSHVVEWMAPERSCLGWVEERVKAVEGKRSP